MFAAGLALGAVHPAEHAFVIMAALFVEFADGFVCGIIGLILGLSD